MKNKYALNETGEVIDIKDVDKSKKEQFVCCSCNRPMVARKGQIKEHHFAHKQKLECNYETYLHKLSKLIFYNVYHNCLLKKQPFYINFEAKYSCYACHKQESLNFVCYERKSTRYDLTKIFDEIQLEKKVGRWIPDILLSSSKSESNKMFFEIAVTHACEFDKIDSGYRIIEKKVRDEDSLIDIFQRELNLESSGYSYYNFREIIDKKTKTENCLKQRFVFKVNEKRQSYFTHSMVAELYDEIKQGNYISIVDKELAYNYEEENDDYIKSALYFELREIELEKYLEKNFIKDVINCRFSWVGYQYRKYPYYGCNKLKDKFNIKKCYECPYHWKKTTEGFRESQLSTRYHFIEMRRRNWNRDF